MTPGFAIFQSAVRVASWQACAFSYPNPLRFPGFYQNISELLRLVASQETGKQIIPVLVAFWVNLNCLNVSRVKSRLVQQMRSERMEGEWQESMGVSSVCVHRVSISQQ